MPKAPKTNSRKLQALQRDREVYRQMMVNAALARGVSLLEAAQHAHLELQKQDSLREANELERKKIAQERREGKRL